MHCTNEIKLFQIMVKWPKGKEAAMKGTFLKTSTTHKARTNKLKDFYRDFVLHFFFQFQWLVGFFFCSAIIKNRVES